MSTGTQIIQGAGRKIGVHSDVDPMTTETLIVGLGILTSMLQLWQSQAIKFEFVPIDPTRDRMVAEAAAAC